MVNRETIKDWGIDQTWTLFLDRDGVINQRIIGDYVKNIQELEILPGVAEAIKKFRKIFGRIVVVTNQQGIGKGLMTEEDLMNIHNHLNKELDGAIDKFYFAPQLKEENHPDRKPAIGMGLKAQKDYPEIDFSISLMIGDSESDIEFGQKLGMKTVFLQASDSMLNADVICTSLEIFAMSLA